MNTKHLKTITRFAIWIFLIMAAFSLSYLRLADDYELQSLDLRFKLRPAPEVSDKIVIIEIGEDSIEKLGAFPFDRSYHAILIKALAESKARAILFDFLFSEPQEHDKELQYAMNQAGNVYVPFAFDIVRPKGSKVLSAGGYIARCIEDIAAESKGTGHVNIVPDPDGKFRRIPAFISYENALYPHISFAIGCEYLGIPLKDARLIAGKYIDCAEYGRIPLDELSNMIVNFSGRWGSSYKHYSYIDILQSYFAKVSGETPGVDFSGFKDKICIIGLTAAGTTDTHPNPFETLYPGMGIHAEVINSIINNNFISRASRTANMAILAVLLLVASLVTLKMKPLKGLFLVILEIFLLFITAFALFDLAGIWIDMVWPILTIVLLYLSVTLYKYVAEWKRRLLFENELGIAKKIQESFLPKNRPEVKGVDIAVRMATAREVGGDLYDFVDFGDGRLGVMIGDVSGKGVPASLFMAMVVGLFRFFAKLYPRPRDVVRNLNAKLASESSSNLFVTIFYAIFDLKNRSVVFTNGGHLPLAHAKRSGGKISFLDVAEGTPLGLMESDYGEAQTIFEDGDIFVFYTDGITEAMNARSELYGAERLEAVINSARNLSSEEILTAIEKDVRKFEPKSRQHDDMTVIVVKL